MAATPSSCAKCRLPAAPPDQPASEQVRRYACSREPQYISTSVCGRRLLRPLRVRQLLRVLSPCCVLRSCCSCLASRDIRMCRHMDVVSTFGSLGAQAQTLIKDIGRRTNLFVPFSLAHETSWATSSITTFLRSALTFQVRKRVAVILREHLPDDFLPPPPIQTSLPLSESVQGNLVGNLPS